MKRLSAVIISGLLLIGAIGCNNTARTSGEAPNDTPNTTTSQNNVETPDNNEIRKDYEDGSSDVRRNQLNSDIRAREQRNDIAGGDADKATSDLASQVRSKLEANIPNGQLTVEAEDNGSVTVAGTVPHSDQLPKIDQLAREIKGVRSVNVEARVSPPQS